MGRGHCQFRSILRESAVNSAGKGSIPHPTRDDAQYPGILPGKSKEQDCKNHEAGVSSSI
jgi:hypothetical protein